jgi:hypothetical protein
MQLTLKYTFNGLVKIINISWYCPMKDQQPGNMTLFVKASCRSQSGVGKTILEDVTDLEK